MSTLKSEIQKTHVVSSSKENKESNRIKIIKDSRISYEEMIKVY